MKLMYKPKSKKKVFAKQCVCQCRNVYSASPGAKKIH